MKVTDYGDWIGTTGVGTLVRRDGVRFGLTLTNEVDTYLRRGSPPTVCAFRPSSRRGWPSSPGATACSGSTLPARA